MAGNFYSMPGAPAPGTVLCELSEIADPGSRNFSFGGGLSFLQLFVVRAQGVCRAFVNTCPHVGSPMDFPPGQFLTPDRTNIRCANHGAVFRIEDGLCLAGPCAGAHLFAVPIAIVGGKITLAAG